MIANKLFFATLFTPVLMFANFRTCPDTKSHLFFGNGMFTSVGAARKTLDKLRKSAPRHDQYDIAYNKNENIIFQIYEVLSQKIESEQISEKNLLELFLSGKVTDSLRKIIFDELSMVYRADLVAGADLTKHLETYKEILKKSRRIHLLAHSQGNFFANSAYDTLSHSLPDRIGAFKIISLANPDRRVADNGPYFTYTNDLIIKYIPFALKGNITRKHPSGSNHGILDAYYRPDELLSRINNEISSTENATRGSINYSEKEKEDIQFYRDSVMKECQRWFLSYVKLEKHNKVSDCSILCPSTSYIDFGFSHCPIQCDALCCTREFGPWPHPIEIER